MVERTMDGISSSSQYVACSNFENAAQLQGDLLLMVGEVDDNVESASSIQLADALIKANKDFDLVVLSGMNHTSGGTYGAQKRKEFFGIPDEGRPAKLGRCVRKRGERT